MWMSTGNALMGFELWYIFIIALNTNVMKCCINSMGRTSFLCSFFGKNYI